MGKGYNNYMTKKFFHPGSKENIKRVWMAEQKAEFDKKKQEDMLAQYQREQEMYGNRALLGDEKAKVGLSFMYDAPPGAKQEREKEDDEPEFKFEWQRKFNAPRESYAKDDETIRDQPFGIEVRNVRCIKCHKWGHVNTDKICPLFGHNITAEPPQPGGQPKSLEDGMREEGFAFKDVVKGRRVNPRAANEQMVDSDSEEDPEVKFLKSLTTKQKKKLLRKLDKLQKSHKEGEDKSSEKKKKKKHKHKKSSVPDSDSDEPKKKKKKASVPTKKERKRSHGSSESDSESDSQSEKESHQKVSRDHHRHVEKSMKREKSGRDKVGSPPERGRKLYSPEKRDLLHSDRDRKTRDEGGRKDSRERARHHSEDKDRRGSKDFSRSEYNRKYHQTNRERKREHSSSSDDSEANARRVDRSRQHSDRRENDQKGISAGHHHSKSSYREERSQQGHRDREDPRVKSRSSGHYSSDDEESVCKRKTKSLTTSNSARRRHDSDSSDSDGGKVQRSRDDREHRVRHRDDQHRQHRDSHRH